MPTFIDANGLRFSPSGTGSFTGIDANGKRFTFSPGSHQQTYRAVLFGDSMTSQFYVDTTATSASYNANSGVLTFTNAGHALPTGWTVDIFNRTYSVLKKHQPLTVTRVDADNYSVQLEANLSGVPNGTLSGTTFARVRSRQGANSWVNWMQMLMGWPFEIVYNGAQSGDTTADCIARIEEHCLDYSPDIVFMQTPGINDMSTGNGPIDENTIAANQQEICETILDYGAVLVCLGLTPVLSSESRATLQNMARVARLNTRLQQFLRGKRNAVYIDSYGRIIDVTSATGLGTTAYLKNVSGDYIHYSIPGALRVGKLARDKLQYAFPANHSTLPRSQVSGFNGAQVTASSVTVSGGVATFNATSHGFLAGEKVHVFGASSLTELNGFARTVLSASANAFTFATTAADGTASGTIVASRSSNILNNHLLSTGTGGTVTAPVTGTCANEINARFHSGSGTAAASVVSQADGFGNAQRLVVSAAVADDLPGFQAETTSALNRYAIAGETFFMEGDLRISSANWANTPISEIMFRLIVTVDSVLYSAHAINTYDGLSGSSLGEDVALHVRTPDLLIPAGTVSQFYWQVYVRASNTVSSDLTLDLSRLAVWRKD